MRRLIPNAPEDFQRLYASWRKLVNLSADEMRAFLETPEAGVAGLTREEARAQGIRSGHDSARWVIRLKTTPVEEWDRRSWDWAMRQVSFIRRMSGMSGALYDPSGRPTPKLLSLMLWGHAPPEVAARMRLPRTVRPGVRADA